MKTHGRLILSIHGLVAMTALVTPALGQRGRLDHGMITSAALTNNLLGDSGTRPFIAYLPPSYDLTQKRYPVVYVLHGFSVAADPGDETTLVTGLQSTLDSMILHRKSGEIIAIFVNGHNRLGGSWYLSSPVIGDYETYIASDLVCLVDNRYRTLAARESRGVHGWSVGGWGAMHLALKFPQTFSVVVAESGRYDSRSPSIDTWERQLAYSHPTNFTQFLPLLSQIPDFLAGTQALFCGLLPNLQRPSLYSDYVYEWTNSHPVFSEPADQRCRSGDVQNGDLGRYLQQPFKLNGIKIVHGTADTVIPLTDARSFTNAMTQAGLVFTYQEHSDGHVYRPDLAVPFLSTNSLGSQLYTAPPQLTFAYATNSILLSFPTQLGVDYRIESSPSLDSATAAWSVATSLTGNGGVARVSLPVAFESRFFRASAVAP
jgi:enterochelin esterase-like enzyme